MSAGPAAGRGYFVSKNDCRIRPSRASRLRPRDGDWRAPHTTHGGGACASRPSCGIEDFLNREDECVELLALGRKTSSPGGGERVVAGAAVVLRRAPGRLDPAVQQEPLQRRLERALPHLEHIV